MSKQRSQRTTEDLPVWPEQVIGGKYIRLLEKQLQTLREEAGHGNQALFLDDVFVVYLLAFFNPSVRSTCGNRFKNWVWSVSASSKQFTIDMRASPETEKPPPAETASPQEKKPPPHAAGAC